MQASPSSQSIDSPTHPPSLHVSATVQASPSSHNSVFGAETQPTSGLHESVVHGFPSLQVTASPAIQTPSRQASPVVQASGRCRETRCSWEYLTQPGPGCIRRRNRFPVAYPGNWSPVSHRSDRFRFVVCRVAKQKTSHRLSSADNPHVHQQVFPLHRPLRCNYRPPCSRFHRHRLPYWERSHIRHWSQESSCRFRRHRHQSCTLAIICGTVSPSARISSRKRPLDRSHAADRRTHESAVQSFSSSQSVGPPGTQAPGHRCRRLCTHCRLRTGWYSAQIGSPPLHHRCLWCTHFHRRTWSGHRERSYPPGKRRFRYTHLRRHRL